MDNRELRKKLVDQVDLQPGGVAYVAQFGFDAPSTSTTSATLPENIRVIPHERRHNLTTEEFNDLATGAAVLGEPG